MATTSILLNGFSILGDPHTNTNAADGGALMIHDGTALFESDDIIVLLVEGAAPDGSFLPTTKITGMVVYDSVSDYYHDTPLYTYTASTGGGVKVPTGSASMGDSYLNFDASSLISTDSGAPVLNDLVVASGMDLVNPVDGYPIEIHRFENLDYNQDGVIDPAAHEVGDGVFSGANNIFTVVCFARGTLIDTPNGPVRIEALRAGDLVSTLDDGAQPIRWIGSRRTEATGHNAPVRIKAGALGNGRDLWVSQNHKMLISGGAAELLFGQSEVLIAAKHLCNDDTIRIVPMAHIEYFHFLFDSHQIVFAEACPAESLFPGKQSLLSVSDAARDEIIQLFPELEAKNCTGDL